MDILKTKNLSKSFDGIYAIKNLSVVFRKSEITGLIGPNGSGKSTLINLLTGIIPIDSGSITFSEKEKVNRLIPYEVVDYGISRTFQYVRLFKQMTVLDNILVVLTKRNAFSSIFEKHKKFHLAQAEDALREVGLWESKNELVENLSYGQKKLLEIGRILAMNASDIIFLDEPFAGVFPEMRKVIVLIIQNLKQKGKTVIFTEHNIDIIRELCDKVIVLESGELLAQGVPDKVLVMKEVVDAYLGED